VSAKPSEVSATSHVEPGTVLTPPQVRVSARWISCSRAASIENACLPVLAAATTVAQAIVGRRQVRK
jgi:hypothetical protein